MTGLDNAAVHRIASIAARTVSDADGEALTAVRMLNRELRRNGLRIEELIAAGIMRDATSSTPSPAINTDHQQLAREALVAQTRFNERELDFLRTMAVARYCSGRQAEWLDGLVARSRVTPPAQRAAA
ncbi:hypothetical protein [Sphingomonas oligophenolica]|uniref:Uncharacterized protein n=1 Tax=Sphingomonas oligophenolica TaxID=301154 RepID=A0A502CKT2_9SPHN|nr:hypothetical protein [Sphingomonas oligophenolica]TPG13180.1 hypothetical protein EAH84_07205 [Sphingomonas oligophenolica]